MRQKRITLAAMVNCIFCGKTEFTYDEQLSDMMWGV